MDIIKIQFSFVINEKFSQNDGDEDHEANLDDVTGNGEEEDAEASSVSGLLDNVSSILQGFAFQHHSTSNQPMIKLFPIVLKTE